MHEKTVSFLKPFFILSKKYSLFVFSKTKNYAFETDTIKKTAG